MLAWPHLGSDDARRWLYRKALGTAEMDATAVHTIHTEVEGGPYAALFERTLDDWRADGVTFVTLTEFAREVLGSHAPITERPVVKTRLPGRGGHVATGWPDEGRKG